jgi:RNA polymerase sigma-70 factor (ECF subfamily)
MKNQSQTVRIAHNHAATPGKPAALATCSDEEMIVLLKARGLGWKLVFNELLGRHRAWLVNHCGLRLGNRQDAQDVAQLVMVRAWRGIDRFEGRAAFRTWLYTIAENQCRTFMQQRMRYLQVEHIDRLIDLTLSNNDCGVERDYALSQAVATVMDQLGENAREVLLLRFFRDYSLDEIAGALSISLSAAKMRLYRALEQFRAGYLELAAGPGECLTA